MEKTNTQILLELLEGWVELRDMVQGLVIGPDVTMEDMTLRIEFLYQMSIRAIQDARALPHPQASDSRPSDLREDERTGDGRSEEGEE